MENYLFDKQFLLTLDNYPEREIYVKIIALDNKENPIETIEGKATGGSINIDGSSALRRTCSLSMVSSNTKITDYYWTLNNKFKLEIGLYNFIKKNNNLEHPEWNSYPTICWFRQGVFLISSFSASMNSNSYTINISGKDKMAKLNGDCGGTLTSSVDFGKTEYYDKITNSSFYEYTPIKDIIYNAVHLYGGELTHKIIINDLDIMGKQLMEYHGEDPLYLIVSSRTGEVVQAILDGNLQCYMCDMEGTTLLNNGSPIKISEIPVYSLGAEYINTTAQLMKTPTTVTFGLTKNNEGLYFTYFVQKIIYGQAAGYEEVPLTYASKDSKSELIGNVGESITSILDKIKIMLGDYEYFYDIDGNFIFQRQQTYANVAWADVINNGDGVFISDIAYGTSTEYDFYNSKLFTAISENPKIDNIKNDYSVWGTKKTLSGASVPIHMRYAIDKKPIQYKTIKVSNEEVENLLLGKYELPLDYFSVKDGTITEDGDYIVTLANDFIYRMKPQLKQTTYIAYTPDILNKQRAMQYLDDDSPELINMVRLPKYNENGDRVSQDADWTKLENVRLQIAEDNNWDLNAAQQYIKLFKLWSLYFGDYAQDNNSDENKVNLALNKLLVPGKERLKMSELELIKTFFKENFNEDLIDFGYNAIDSSIKYVDWREIIYQMAKDFYAYNELDNFNWKIIEANGERYPQGITGYERYYIDMNGFWRDQYWGWDEDLEATIKDILIQYIRPANREIIEDEDIQVRSKMVPIVAKELLTNLDNDINEIYKNEQPTTQQDIGQHYYTVSDLNTGVNKVISITLTPTTKEKLELVQIFYDKDRREDQRNFSIDFKDNEKLAITTNNSAFTFQRTVQGTTGSIFLLPITNVNIRGYTITIKPVQQEMWSDTITIKINIAHNVELPALPQGVSQSDYYIYEHNPSEGYSSFIPWWQYDVEMKIDLKDYLTKIDTNKDIDKNDDAMIYFPYEQDYSNNNGLESFSINQLSKKMIEWIDNGGHCHDLMFLFFATLRRRKILKGRKGQDKKYSIFAARQFEDLFVLWDEYESQEAKVLLKAKVEYEIRLAKAIKNNNEEDLGKINISTDILREVQSLYRITFYEEYLNLLVTTPDVINLINGDGVLTRPETSFEDSKIIIYQIIAHLESSTTAADSEDRNTMKRQLLQLLEEYRESSANIEKITIPQIIKITNLATLWIMWYDEPKNSVKNKISRAARQVLIYSGEFDNSIIDFATFKEVYFKQFNVEYDGTHYYGLIDDNTDYSQAMLEYAKTIHAYVLDRNKTNANNWKLMEDTTFKNLLTSRMAKVIKFNYNREAAQQLQNMYVMFDYYGIGTDNPSGGNTGVTDGAGIILDYLMDNQQQRKEKPISKRISGWNNNYKAVTGVDFKPGLETIDNWEKKTTVNIDYSEEMIAYIQRPNASSNDEEWISLAQKRKNKVLTLNYSYPAAVQFENLCVLYMDHKNDWSAKYLDIVLSIITGVYKSDADVINNRITY